MEQSEVVIATMTWARDEEEEQLLRKAVLELSRLNIPTFISDGGSNDSFIGYLQSFSNFTVLQPQVKGLWPQVQSSLKAAYETGSKFIIYTEPDKMDYFKTGLPDLIKNSVADEQTGIVVAVRSPEGFASYPSFQQMCETTINNCCSEATTLATDYTYGPFIMNRKILPHLNEIQNTIGWGWRPYVFVIASRLKYFINTLEGAYFCPVDQQADNATERIYRMKQLAESVEGIVLASKVKM